MGLELVEGGESRGYGSTRVKGEYTVKLKGSYDIAVLKQGDGTYALKTDMWGGNVAREVGENCGTLMQGYGEHATREAAHRRGMSVYKTIEADGTIQLALRSYVGA